MLEVITYPNPLLRQISKPIENFDESLHQLLDAMYETMLNKNGVGISAIQVAKPIRALLICLPDEEGNQHKENLLEIINPEIIDEEVKRYSSLKIHYQNRYGENLQLEANDYLAVALQHEIDHLNGILFIDKLSIIKRKKFEKELKQKRKS